MAGIQQLEKLRPLGKLEQVSASCHHLGFFNNVGLSAHYKLPESSSSAVSDLRRLIFAAVGDVIRKHRILFAIPVNEDTPNAYFASLRSVNLNRSITFVKRSQPCAGGSEGEDRELDAILEEQHNTDFKSEYGTLPFWRLIILLNTGEENEFTASFIYHHAIGDGVSGLVLHNAFRDALDAVTSSSSPYDKTDETIVPDENTSVLQPLEDLHPLPINPTPPGPPATSLEEWTGNVIRIPCKSRWASFGLSPSASKAFFQECKENDVSVTSALSSIIATVLFRALPPTAEALTCIIPVSLRPWLKLPREVANGAVGTYFDATKMQFKRPDHNSQDPGLADVFPGAYHVSKAMNDYLGNTSPSGEPYTAVAPFKNIPDVSVIFNSMIGKPRDAAFEVTNIGLFSSLATPKTKTAPIWQVDEVLLSRSSVASGAAVTVSVATGGNGSMGVGFSWQEGVIEDAVVDNIIQGARKFFQRYQ